MGRSALDSLDEATRSLHDALIAAPAHLALLDAMRAVAGTQGNGLDAVALVPGILYRHYPQTGADGQRVFAIARRLGARCVLAPSDGTRGLQAGAGTVLDTLLSLPAGRANVIVSLSKGSAEVRAALEHPRAPEAFARVRAWISLSGLPLGTEALEATLRSPLRGSVIRLACRYKRIDLEGLRDVLRPRPDARFDPPPHLRIVHVHGFPRRADLTDRRSRRLHRAQAHAGPNDGFAALEAIARLPGQVYPVPGADHYLRTPDDLPLGLERLLVCVVSERWPLTA